MPYPLRRAVSLAFFLALFAYALLDWVGWLPFERGFKPLRTVLLTAALVLQSSAALLRPRSRLLFYGLLVASMVLLVATFVIAS